MFVSAHAVMLVCVRVGVFAARLCTNECSCVCVCVCVCVGLNECDCVYLLAVCRIQEALGAQAVCYGVRRR